MSEEGNPGFEHEAAERELEELRRGIEESRLRRRRANEAFDQFLKGFDRAPRRDTPPPAVAPRPSAPPTPVTPPIPLAAPSPPAPAPPEPAPVASLPAQAPPAPVLSAAPAVPAPPVSALPAPVPPVAVRSAAAPAALDLARTDEARFASPPSSRSWKPDAVQVSDSAVSDLAEGRGAASARPQLPAIPAARTPPPSQPRNLHLPTIAAVVAVAILATVLLARSRRDGPPPLEPAQSSPAGTVPQPAPTPAATTSAVRKVPPAAEIWTSRRVWLRVTVDGERVVEREVDAGTKIPLTPTSQLIVRTGDAGAVRVSIGGKDQGPLGPAGQVVTRSFVMKQGNGRHGEPVK